MSATITTDRMQLRPPGMADAERIALFLADFGVSGNLARVPHPYTIADARAWLRTRVDDLGPEQTVFAMDIPSDGLVGHIGYHLGAANEPVIGYWLGRPYWGRGLMTEAVLATLRWFFDCTDAPRVVSGVFDFNLPSLAIQKRVGFEEIGRSRLLCLARGEELGHIDTALTRARWAGAQA